MGRRLSSLVWADNNRVKTASCDRDGRHGRICTSSSFTMGDPGSHPGKRVFDDAYIKRISLDFRWSIFFHDLSIFFHDIAGLCRIRRKTTCVDENETRNTNGDGIMPKRIKGMATVNFPMLRTSVVVRDREVIEDGPYHYREHGIANHNGRPWIVYRTARTGQWHGLCKIEPTTNEER
jgi:hypothetical protein